MKKLLKYSIGTDISKEKFDACISVIDEEQQVQPLFESAPFTGHTSSYLHPETVPDASLILESDSKKSWADMAEEEEEERTNSNVQESSNIVYKSSNYYRNRPHPIPSQNEFNNRKRSYKHK